MGSAVIYLHLLCWLVVMATSAFASKAPRHTNVVIVGGTGDLARKYLWKSMFELYIHNADENATFSFYAAGRSTLSDGKKIFDNILEDVQCEIDDKVCENVRPQFISRCQYATLKTTEQFIELCATLSNLPIDPGKEIGQIFYLSIPASAYESVAGNIHTHCRHGNATWTRVVLEKPFGSDRESAAHQAEVVGRYFKPEELYRVDHYLGKSVVKAILQFRDSNKEQLEPLLNSQYVDRVEIVMKETIGVKGRIDFYDQYGVVRDVMQNHLTELLALVTMELPANCSSSESIERKRLKLLRSVTPVRKKSLLVGQYAGYIKQAQEEKENVSSSHFTPTFGAALLRVDSARWSGIPFLVISGKHMEERSSYVRILFREREFCVSGCSNSNSSHNKYPRQLVFQIGNGAVPSPGILVSKSLFEPTWPPELTELSITSKDSVVHGQSPGDFYYAVPKSNKPAYHSVMQDLYMGVKQSFVTAERVLVLWDIWSSVLHETRSLLPRLYQESSNTNLNFHVINGQLLFKTKEESVFIDSDLTAQQSLKTSYIPQSFRNATLVCKAYEALIQEVASFLLEAAELAVASRGIFHVAFSGGKTPIALFDILVQDSPQFPWQHTHIWQVDERCVSQRDDNSNFRSIQDSLLRFVNIPYLNIHPMPVDNAGDLCNHDNKGDNLYEQTIRYLIPDEKFDLVMLGVGNDGHTASLFPESSVLNENSRLVSFTESSGTTGVGVPVSRLSLLFPAINQARHIAVLVTGKDKHDILHKIAKLESKSGKFPITMVQPTDGNMTWFVDHQAWIG